MTQAETILLQCSGIKVETVPHRLGITLIKVGDVRLPVTPIYIRITATATKGTVARLVGVDCVTFGDLWEHTRGQPAENTVALRYVSFTYEIGGRPKPGKIAGNHIEVLNGYHEPKYVRTSNSARKKVVVKNPINKFKQELQKGDWVFGIGQGQRLVIGRVTRWSAHHVWCSTGDVLDKSKEVQLVSVKETFLSGEAHLPELTLAVLKGWNGK